MGKIDAQSQARMDGMAYALKIAKERGIDGLIEVVGKRMDSVTKRRVAVYRLRKD